MTRLALAAILLMALAPTVSRTLASTDISGHVKQAIQICTMAGLQTKVVAALWDDQPGDQGERAPIPHPHEPGDACGYCSLVTPFPVVLVLLCGLLLLAPVAPAFLVRVAGPRAYRNRRGLGAQGPPVAF